MKNNKHSNNTKLKKYIFYNNLFFRSLVKKDIRKNIPGLSYKVKKLSYGDLVDCQVKEGLSKYGA